MRLEHLLSGEDDCLSGKSRNTRSSRDTRNTRFAISPKASLLRMFINIEKDEAERREAKLEASPIAQLVRAPH